MSNTFGRLFRVSSYGESHGVGIGVVIDGCPAGLELDLEAVQHALDRRRPGQSRITTQRKEPDQFELLSGTVGNTTTGTPLAFLVRNKDQRSKDYDHIEQVFRPSHADFTWFSKFGIRDHRGGGRSSARETVARVIAGAVARQFLEQAHEVKIEGWVDGVGKMNLNEWPETIDFSGEFREMVRCPDPDLAKKMVAAIDKARKEGNSMGGRIGCRARGVPPGWGAPVFDKLHAVLGHALLSINAVKGIEFGSGFAGSEMFGSQHNDEFYMEGDRVRTRSNRSGGIQGGISNGEDILLKLAFKPTSTIMRDQQTVNSEGESTVAKGKGRHDPCVVPRAVPIVEAMVAMVLMDFALLSRADRI